jgi:hypothetical protein
MDVTQRMHKAGVKFLAGTDVSQWNFLVPGLSLHDELARLVETGFSPLEALQTATINPAEYLSITDAGTVAAGKRRPPDFGFGSHCRYHKHPPDYRGRAWGPHHVSAPNTY